MKSRSLVSAEVALIKAMLRRGMRNNEIQFYFNRPERPVNSGRITEIKKGIKWTDIEPATDKKLGVFLAQVDGENNHPADGEPVVPDQLPAAVVFSLNENGRIAVVPDPPGRVPGTDPEQGAMYIELRQKTDSILDAGANLLGQMLEPLRRFRNALPEDMSTASMTIIWFRGNALRSILRAHDEVKELQDVHPEKLDAAYAEHLRDIVEAFNIFVLGDPKGSELDYRRLGPMGREVADEAIELAKPIAEHSPEVATEAVSSLLQEQIDGAANAPNTIDGDQAVALARQTSSNFVIAIAQSAYSFMRKVLGDELSVAWKNTRKGVYWSIGASAVTQPQLIIDFILHHIDKLSSYAVSVIENPTVHQIFDFIVRCFS
jgi:hypothetical protein